MQRPLLTIGPTLSDNFYPEQLYSVMSENGALQDIIYAMMKLEANAAWDLNITKGRYFNARLSKAQEQKLKNSKI